MAPRKKSSRVKDHESSKVSSTEYTPVKASTSRNDAHTPAVCITRGRGDYESVDESPSPGMFSPVNKPACDIEWAWKSPVGRMGSAANSTKRRLINKTPVQKTKRCSKANSPLNHFPSKRKLIKVEHQDSDHLSILTSQLEALKQCVLDEKNPDAHSGPSTYALPNKNSAKEDDSLIALLDDDNYFTLLQCSQYVEEKVIDIPDKTAFSPIYIKPLVKNTSLDQPLAPKPSSFTPETIKNHLTRSKEIETDTETNQLIVINADKGNELSCSDRVVEVPVNVASRKDLTKLVIGQTKPLQEKPVQNYKFDNIFADDSFDDALANFCDENIELLSQGKSSSQPETPNNVLELSISCEEKRTNLPSLPESRKVASNAAEMETASVAAYSSTLYTFDDDFLQPDMLKMLDAIECSSLAKSPRESDWQTEPSPPRRCTPEEIEKKRLEAKMKLDMKKRASVVTNRLPSRSSVGNLRR